MMCQWPAVPQGDLLERGGVALGCQLLQLVDLSNGSLLVGRAEADCRN
jgi:hypothetical protein